MKKSCLAFQFFSHLIVLTFPFSRAMAEDFAIPRDQVQITGSARSLTIQITNPRNALIACHGTISVASSRGYQTLNLNRTQIEPRATSRVTLRSDGEFRDAHFEPNIRCEETRTRNNFKSGKSRPSTSPAHMDTSPKVETVPGN